MSRLQASDSKISSLHITTYKRRYWELRSDYGEIKYPDAKAKLNQDVIAVMEKAVKSVSYSGVKEPFLDNTNCA